MVALYTNAFHNSTYVALILLFCVIFLSVTLYTLGSEILNLQSEFSSTDDNLGFKYKKFFQYWLLFTFTIAIAIAVPFCHYLTINSNAAETICETLFYFSALSYVFFILVFMRAAIQLYKITSNRNSILISRASTTASQFMLAEKQLKLTKVISSLFLGVVLVIILIFFILAAGKSMFKIYWLSLSIFSLIGIVIPIFCLTCSTIILVLEYQKKGLSHDQIQLTSSLLSDTNQSLLPSED